MANGTSVLVALPPLPTSLALFADSYESSHPHHSTHQHGAPAQTVTPLQRTGDENFTSEKGSAGEEGQHTNHVNSANSDLSSVGPFPPSHCPTQRRTPSPSRGASAVASPHSQRGWHFFSVLQAAPPSPSSTAVEGTDNHATKGRSPSPLPLSAKEELVNGCSTRAIAEANEPSMPCWTAPALHRPLCSVGYSDELRRPATPHAPLPTLPHRLPCTVGVSVPRDDVAPSSPPLVDPNVMEMVAPNLSSAYFMPLTPQFHSVMNDGASDAEDEDEDDTYSNLPPTSAEPHLPDGMASKSLIRARGRARNSADHSFCSHDTSGTVPSPHREAATFAEWHLPSSPCGAARQFGSRSSNRTSSGGSSNLHSKHFVRTVSPPPFDTSLPWETTMDEAHAQRSTTRAPSPAVLFSRPSTFTITSTATNALNTRSVTDTATLTKPSSNSGSNHSSAQSSPFVPIVFPDGTILGKDGDATSTSSAMISGPQHQPSYALHLGESSTKPEHVASLNPNPRHQAPQNYRLGATAMLKNNAENCKTQSRFTPAAKGAAMEHKASELTAEPVGALTTEALSSLTQGSSAKTVVAWVDDAVQWLFSSTLEDADAADSAPIDDVQQSIVKRGALQRAFQLRHGKGTTLPTEDAVTMTCRTVARSNEESEEETSESTPSPVVSLTQASVCAYSHSNSSEPAAGSVCSSNKHASRRGDGLFEKLQVFTVRSNVGGRQQCRYHLYRHGDGDSGATKSTTASSLGDDMEELKHWSRKNPLPPEARGSHSRRRKPGRYPPLPYNVPPHTARQQGSTGPHTHRLLSNSCSTLFSCSRTETYMGDSSTTSKSQKG